MKRQPVEPKPRGLHLGGLELPEQAVTETFAILGKRGSGKTTTARVLAEELLTLSLPVVVLDPTGVWWGLRSSADGESDGYPVVIFGGDHADVPLEQHAGDLIADVIVDERIPAVLDLSHLSKTNMRSFTAVFLERLYRRNRDPLQVIIDEADLFAPQRMAHGQERLLGAMDDLVRRGRVRGLGTVLITQRPQVLNKDVLSQAEALIALRMVGKRDIDAIDDWVRVHAEEDEARQVKASLPSLPVGTAWLWSPGWLGILEQVEVQRPSTFDSSATPKPGERRQPVKRMATVDLAELGERIATTVERAKEQDPKALRARIGELERKLAAAESAKPEQVKVEVPAVSPETLGKLTELGEQLVEARAQFEEVARGIAGQVDAVQESLREAVRVFGATPPRQPAPVKARPERRRAVAQSRGAPTAAEEPVPTGEELRLGVAHRKVLTALAQHGTLTHVQAATIAGYSHKSGGYRNALGALRSAGYIEGGRDAITITEAGAHALGPYEPLPTGTELREWWKANQLGLAERRIIDALASVWPDPLTHDEVAEMTEYQPTSGGFRNALGRLRTLELIHGGKAAISITDTLMGD